MTPGRRVRQVLTVAGALAVVGGVLWYRNRAPVMSGTKATFSLVGTSAAPAGGPGGPNRTTTTTTANPAAATTTGAR
jgi:hypothetical protein